MKKRWLRVLVALLAAALLVSVLVQVYAYVEKQDCICAKLTTEEQEFEIDDRLRAFYEGVDEQTGVFIRFLSPCRHGKSIHLTIFPDEGIYRGMITK